MAVCQILLICPSAIADCTSHFAFAYPPIAHIALASLVTRVIGVLCHVHERASRDQGGAALHGLTLISFGTLYVRRRSA